VIERLALYFILGSLDRGEEHYMELPSDLCQLRTEAKAMSGRDAAMVNGALIALGILGIVDNVVFHWMLELHRAVPGPHALTVEVVGDMGE
jgi:hypothetical protein